MADSGLGVEEKKIVIAESAIDLQTGNKVAVKLEDNLIKRPQLFHEADVLKDLNSSSEAVGIPKLIYKGSHNSLFNVMVEELLGRDLEEVLKDCKGQFSLKTVLVIADQMIKILQYIHVKGYLHRDLKPGNVTLGLGDFSKCLFLFDFGLARRYKIGNVHIPYRTDRSLVGTIRFASISNHLGIEQSRRDDLESLLYMLIYFLKGRLPWQGLKEQNKAKRMEKIRDIKTGLGVKKICSGLPNVFPRILKYVRSLGFKEDPDYDFIRKSFQKLFEDRKFKNNFLFDWTILKIGKVRTQQIMIRPKLTVASKITSMTKAVDYQY